MTGPGHLTPDGADPGEPISLLSWVQTVADQNVPAELGPADEFVIVAHFYDVESGRTLEQLRGPAHTHEQFDSPIPRDGNVADLLTEASQPDRRFVAVICESIERVARTTYAGTTIEYELEQAGVALLGESAGLWPSPTAWGRASLDTTRDIDSRTPSATDSANAADQPPVGFWLGTSWPSWVAGLQNQRAGWAVCWCEHVNLQCGDCTRPCLDDRSHPTRPRRRPVARTRACSRAASRASLARRPRQDPTPAPRANEASW